MDRLNNYNIKSLDLNEIEDYTKVMLEAFDLEYNYDMYLDNNIYNYTSGHKFLTAKLVRENVIIGGICLEGKPKYRNEIFIEHIFVDEKYRNQNVATSLLEYIIENKNEIFKMNKINLYLFCENHVREFYLKNRFYETNIVMNKNLEKVLRMDRNI